jgi:hypothetical protein
MSPSQSTPPVTSHTSVATLAAQASAALRALSAALPLDDALPPRDANASKVSNRVSLEVLEIVASILEAAPDQYPHFDAKGARASIAYEQAMRPVADDLRALAARIDRSILKRRSKNASEALALYGTLKSVARLPAKEAARDQVKQLKELLTTYKPPRAEKVTKKELEATAQKMKKTKEARAKAAEAAIAAEVAVAAANAAGITDRT